MKLLAAGEEERNIISDANTFCLELSITVIRNSVHDLQII